MKPAVSRGDTPLNIKTWPQAIVAVAGLAAVAGILVALVLAGWSSEAVVGFAVAIAGIATGQYVNTRKTSELDAKQDQQSTKLDTVVRQTNGELQETVSSAVEAGIARAVAKYRQENERG
jgi:hypothetical protein